MRLIKACRQPDEKKYSAKQYFDWVYWLHKTDPECHLAKKALDEASAEHPEFKPTTNPDFLHWSETGFISPRTPWTPDELLAKPPADWLDHLLSFEGSLDGPDRRGLMSSIEEAAMKEFDWSLDLADALAINGKWEVPDIWPALLRSWSDINNEDRHRRVIDWLAKKEVYQIHQKEVAYALLALVEGRSASYALNLLPQANKIATALWRHLIRAVNIKPQTDWLFKAINHPAGDIAKFWLTGFALWRNRQDPKPLNLNEEYQAALSEIIEDQYLPGLYGRTVLAEQFNFLFNVDEAWTRENLLPLFKPNKKYFQAAWNGFLTGGRLNHSIAEAMEDVFIETIMKIGSLSSSYQEKFIEYYTYLLVYFVDNVREQGIPEIFSCTNQYARKGFAWNIYLILLDMNEETQQECWNRWLKRYWEDRLQGVPSSLESYETKYMLNWLPHLRTVFPKAVKLAVQMQKPTYHAAADYVPVIDELKQTDLLQSHSEEVSKLIVYLGDCELPEYTWESVLVLIDKLLQENLSADIQKQLKELRISME